MASFNKVILIGNMTADPELKKTPNGVSVTSFSIAVNRRFAKQDGQQQTDFINIVAWRQTAEFVARYFNKGKPILICGQLQTRSWTDNDGKTRYAMEVVVDSWEFAQSKNEAVGGFSAPSASTSSSSLYPSEPAAQYAGDIDGFMPLDDEELPF